MRLHRPILAGLLVAVCALAASSGGVASQPAASASLATAEPLVADDAAVAVGQQLFATSCASCHGTDGVGTQDGPSLVGVGSASADFQLRTGRMPFAGPPGGQAQRKPPAFDDEQIAALVAYVASLGNGPEIPVVEPDDRLVARGQELYLGNCAPCHGATGNGGAVGEGALAPPLGQATPVLVGEALLTGPGQMPVFALGSEDVNAVATYVDYLQTAPHPGGLSIGGIGPVPEGYVAWILGLALLLIVVYLIGRDWGGTGSERPE